MDLPAPLTVREVSTELGCSEDAETRQRIGEWNELGRKLCSAFLAAAGA